MMVGVFLFVYLFIFYFLFPAPGNCLCFDIGTWIFLERDEFFPGVL